MIRIHRPIASHYRKLRGLSIAIREDRMIHGTAAMNETFGGTDGVLYLDLGPTHCTRYHLSIICPRTRVVTDTGDVLIGGLADAPTDMTRTRRAGCACIEGASS